MSLTIPLEISSLQNHSMSQLTVYCISAVQFRTRCVGEQEVKVIWQKAPHGGPIPRLGVTQGGRKLYNWIPGVGFPISVP